MRPKICSVTRCQRKRECLGNRVFRVGDVGGHIIAGVQELVAHRATVFCSSAGNIACGERVCVASDGLGVAFCNHNCHVSWRAGCRYCGRQARVGNRGEERVGHGRDTGVLLQRANQSEVVCPKISGITCRQSQCHCFSRRVHRRCNVGGHVITGVLNGVNNGTAG